MEVFKYIYATLLFLIAQYRMETVSKALYDPSSSSERDTQSSMATQELRLTKIRRRQKAIIDSSSDEDEQ